MSLSPAVLPLSGRTALVTGVSRRRGIGFGVAAELARLGASVFVQHWAPHDRDLPWGDDDLEAMREELRAELAPGALLGDSPADLADAASIDPLLDAAFALTGGLDILVCNHAKSGDDGSIYDMTAARLDAFWQVNARSTILLTRGFADRRAGIDGTGREARRPGDRGTRAQPLDEFATGRVIWMTSGQINGPMPGEVAYVASKAALAGLTPTVAAELLESGILLNTINPGPVNTGYLDAATSDRDVEATERMLRATPFGRFGQPAEPARLIGWLCSDDGRWMVGQVLTSDGGFGIA